MYTALTRAAGAMFAAAALALPLTTGMSTAAAEPEPAGEPCPDIEVVFARGTNEAPGVGGTGQAFVDALRAQAAPRTVAVTPVDYAASDNFFNREAFFLSVVEGVRDAGERVSATAVACPDTDIVLGGFSQGAVLAGYTTADTVPPGVPPELVPAPLTAEVADNVSAVVLIGRPSDRFLADVGAPPMVVGPLFEPVTLEICAPDDTVCNGAPVGGPSIAHSLYGINGLTNEAATSVIGQL